MLSSVWAMLCLFQLCNGIIIIVSKNNLNQIAIPLCVGSQLTECKEFGLLIRKRKGLLFIWTWQGLSTFWNTTVVTTFF